MPWSHDIPIVLSDIKFHGKDGIENTSASYPVLPTAQKLFKMRSRCSYIRLLTSSTDMWEPTNTDRRRMTES